MCSSIFHLRKIFCHRPHSERCCGSHLENGQHSLTNHQFGVANLINNVRPLMITSAELENSPEISKVKTDKIDVSNNGLHQTGITISMNMIGLLNVLIHNFEIKFLSSILANVAHIKTHQGIKTSTVNTKNLNRTMDAKEKSGLHTSGYSVMSQRKLANDKFRCNNIIPKSNLCFLMPATVTSNLLSPNSRRPFSALDSKIKNLSVEEIREQYWGNNFICLKNHIKI